jgi:GTP 3',8-cyclase
MAITDQLQRPLRDLRVSVTDRCNFRCTYCMPREVFGPDFTFLERAELLTFEEIHRIVAVFAGLGVTKLRLTGGEPLLRRGIADLVGMLTSIEGVDDIALTTNGSLLPRHAEALKAAGLSRLTVSLDSVDEKVFSSMADVDLPLSKVLDGIAAATAAGFGPIKLNAVVKRGVNDAGILPLVDYAREHGHIVRFIAYMDVGTTNGWNLADVVPAAQIVERIAAEHPLEPLDPTGPGEVAARYGFIDGTGEVGVITSVTSPFCRTCTRGRLSAVGELYTCLFGAGGTDLRALLRGGATDDELRALVSGTWEARTDRYSELRSAGTADLPRVEMSYIGG